MEIELSDSASAVITEMARRGRVKPQAIARLCLEQAVAGAIDQRVAEDGDVWFIESAKDLEQACRQCWREVDEPGSYAVALRHDEH